VPLDELVNFQGKLKSLSDDAAAKLERLIIKRGFSFPVFVWGGDKIIDGHQRIEVTRRLVADGYKMAGDIPVCDIEADTEKEAAEKLLELQGQYGKITDEGLMEFVENFDIDLPELAFDLEIPGIDIDFLKSNDNKNIEIEPVSYAEEKEERGKITITFPEFVRKDILTAVKEIEGVKIYE
jgi:hypothetical protein